jgi:Transglycosylase SLT domain
MFAASAAKAGEAAVAMSEPADGDGGRKPPSARRSAALSRSASTEEICAMLVASADAHQLPLPFFVRLIWQESRFRSNAVSWAGARGIAQFMPGTANWRGLTDPHDPIQSLYKSAHYLRDLRAQFGNLGLAAAAYNGGSGRVQAWLEGRGGLPAETRQYVHIVTGVPVDQWRVPGDDLPVATSLIPASIPCPWLLTAVAAKDAAVAVKVAVVAVKYAAIATKDTAAPAKDLVDLVVLPAPPQAAAADETREPSGPWGVIVAGDPSPERARAQFANLQRDFSSVLGDREPTIVTKRMPTRGPMPITTIWIDEPDRASADRLCARLRASGGNCVVMRSAS